MLYGIAKGMSKYKFKWNIWISLQITHEPGVFDT